MKTHLLWVCLFLVSCSVSRKTAIDNEQIFHSYTKPFKIFAVGYWPDGYMVLTLTDAHSQYFIIKTLADTSYKIGLAYNH